MDLFTKKHIIKLLNTSAFNHIPLKSWGINYKIDKN